MLYEVYFQNGPITWRVATSKNLSEIFEIVSTRKAQTIYIYTFTEDRVKLVSLRCCSSSEIPKESEFLDFISSAKFYS
jgi:hypothetical protein